MGGVGGWNGGLRRQTNQLPSSSDARTKGSWQIGAGPQGRAQSEHSWFHTDPKGEGRVTHRLYKRMRMLWVVGGGTGTACNGAVAAGILRMAWPRIHNKTGVAWQGQGMRALWQRARGAC